MVKANQNELISLVRKAYRIHEHEHYCLFVGGWNDLVADTQQHLLYRPIICKQQQQNKWMAPVNRMANSNQKSYSIIINPRSQHTSCGKQVS